MLFFIFSEVKINLTADREVMMVQAIVGEHELVTCEPYGLKGAQNVHHFGNFQIPPPQPKLKRHPKGCFFLFMGAGINLTTDKEVVTVQAIVGEHELVMCEPYGLKRAQNVHHFGNFQIPSPQP